VVLMPLATGVDVRSFGISQYFPGHYFYKMLGGLTFFSFVIVVLNISCIFVTIV